MIIGKRTHGQVEVKKTKRGTNNLNTGPIRERPAYETGTGLSVKMRNRQNGRTGNLPAVADLSGGMKTPILEDMSKGRTWNGNKIEDGNRALKRKTLNRTREARTKNGKGRYTPLIKKNKIDH